jgi:hypothetical protein
MASYGSSIGSPVQAMNAIKAAAGESKTNMELFAGSLSTVIPIAANAKISFADVAGLLATMTQHGETADHATQGLASAITHLQNPTGVMTKEMAQLGIDSNDVSMKLGDGPGGRGLAGTIGYLSQAILSKMGPSGGVLLSALNNSKIAADKAHTAFAALPPQAQALADSYDKGAISLGGWRKAVKALPADQANMANQWKTMEDRSKGFSDQLKGSNPLVQTYAAALAKATGTQLSLNTVLEVTGNSAAFAAEATKRIADQAALAGNNVQGWESTQNTFNGTMDRFKETIGVLGIKLGTDLLPVVTKVMQGFLAGVGFIERNSTAFKVLAVAVGSVVLPMYAITKAVALYSAAMRGVAAVQAVWAGATVLYERVAASMGFVTGAGERMIATQAEVEATVASTAAALEGETVAADSAATSITVLTEAEARAGSVAVVSSGEINTLAAAEVRAGTAAAGAATEVGALGAAETEAGAAGAGAAGGIGAAGAAARGASLRFGVMAAGALALVNNLHAASSAGGKAKQVVDGLMTVQDRSRVSDYQQRVSNLEGELHKVTGVGAFFKGILGSIGFGKSGQQMITESNKIGKALEVAKQQAANAQLATDALSKEYHLNSDQVGALAHKYGIDLGGSVNASIGRFQQMQGKMGDTRAGTDVLRGHVDNLGNAVRALPQSHDTHVATPGAQQSTVQVQLLHRTLDGIHDITHTVTTIFKTVGTAVGNVASDLWGRLTHPFGGHAAGGLVGMADGGLIRGPGTGTSDSILGLAAGGMPTAAVSNGEYVVNAAQTAKNLPLLDAINSGKGGKGSLDAGYGKLAADATALATKSRDLTKRFVDQTKAIKDQNAGLDDGHNKLKLFTDATTAHHTAVDSLIPRVVASTNVHQTDHRTVDGLTGGYHTLTGAIQATPTAHHTNTDAPGAVNTTSQIRTLESTIRAMQPKTDRITIDTSVSGVFASLFANGGRVGYATGGQLRGPGTGTSDSIPIMASHGEFVVNAKDTARTLPLLQAINAGMFAQGGMIRKFAAGGAVAARVSDPTTTNAGQFVGGAANLINRVDAMLNPKAHSLIEHKAADAVKKKIAAMSAGVGGGVARWTPLVLAAMGMLGISPGLLGVVMSQMNTESGGNPGSINLTDSNAAAGHPSQGLMQVIPGTFAAYAGPFRGRGILDPLANIYAALNYAKHRYGPGLSALGHGHGYASGGLIMEDDPRFNPTTMGNRRSGLPGFWNLSIGQINAAKADMSALGFGSNIRAAQRRLGVAADGVVGPRTFAALQRAMSRPAPAAEHAFLGMLDSKNQELSRTEGWSGLLGNTKVTRSNAGMFSAWVGQMTRYEHEQAGFVDKARANMAANPGSPGARALYVTALGWDQRAKNLVTQAKATEARARAAVAGREAVTRTAGPTSRGYSWLALHSPIAPSHVAGGPSHAHVTTVVKLDSKVLYAQMQTQALKTEKRNGTNNLSKSRG